MFLPNELYHLICSYKTSESEIRTFHKLLTEYDIYALNQYVYILDRLNTYSSNKWNNCAKQKQFHEATRHGDLVVLQWLHNIYNMTPNDNKSYVNDSLLWASFYGHLEVLQWLHNTYNLTPDDAKSEDNYAFRMASSNGHTNVTDWLTETYGIH